LSKLDHLILVCGHYEGVDERILNFIDEEISIGDYVLTGGEIPAMVLIDTIVRLLPGTVKEEGSVTGDTLYGSNLLKYAQYTRPQKFLKYEVPEILLSGNHEKIKKWRQSESIKRTRKKRPDLIKGKEQNNGQNEKIY